MANIFAFNGIVPVVHRTAFVCATATIIGDVIIEEGCYVGPGACLRGDFGRLVMRAGSNVQDGCVVHGGSERDTIIGARAIVSHGAFLHGCEIKTNALVGINSVVMDGAVIGEQAFVAAMSFVKSGFLVPARTLVMGVPARVVRRISAKEKGFLEGGWKTYRRLAARSLKMKRITAPLHRAGKKRLAQRNAPVGRDD